MWQPILALTIREYRSNLRRSGDLLVGVVFFVIALSLFPFGVGPGPQTLSQIGAGVIWVLALLAVLLGLDRLWQSDLEDGSLELMLTGPAPLELLVLVKSLVHWSLSGVILALVSPILGVVMNIPAAGLWALPLTLLIGTPTLTLLGSIGAALLIGAKKSSAMIGLLVLPLYIPVLIFGIAAIDGAVSGLGNSVQLLILGAMALLAAAFAPFATAAALRLALE